MSKGVVRHPKVANLSLNFRLFLYYAMAEIQNLQTSPASLHFQRLYMPRQSTFPWFEDALAKTAWQVRVVAPQFVEAASHTWGLMNMKDPASYSESSSFIPSYSNSWRTLDSYFSHEHLTYPQSSSLVSPLIFSDSRRKQKSKLMLGWNDFGSLFFGLFIALFLIQDLNSFLTLAPKQTLSLSLSHSFLRIIFPFPQNERLMAERTNTLCP